MDFKLPDLGEGVHEGQILAVHVREGQSISEDDLLLEVETDKAAVEIPSPCTGVVATVHVKDKQLVHVGDVMVTFNTAAEVETVAPPSHIASTTTGVRSSPSVRKLARNLGLDIFTITGSGPGGRITRTDVENIAAKPGATEVVDTTITRIRTQPTPTLTVESEIEGVQEQNEFGIVIRQPMSQARKSISKAMSHAWETIPHVTDCNDADITDIDALRKNFKDPDQPNLTLTLLPFVLKAVDWMLSDQGRANEVLGAIQNQTTANRVDTVAGNILREGSSIEHAVFPDARTRSVKIIKTDSSQRETFGHEMFGPIVYIIETASTDESIEIASSIAIEQGAISCGLYSTDEKIIEKTIDAMTQAGVPVSCNLVGNIWMNQSAAFSDFHVSGANPSGNATLSDAAFVVGRFNVVQNRTFVPEPQKVEA